MAYFYNNNNDKIYYFSNFSYKFLTYDSLDTLSIRLSLPFVFNLGSSSANKSNILFFLLKI